MPSFTGRSRFRNEIVCELDRIQFETLDKRVSATQFLTTNIGAVSLDQVLEYFWFPAHRRRGGARRVQTLNMVNADIIDKYQLREHGPDDGDRPSAR